MIKKTFFGYCFLITSMTINTLAISPTFAATKAQVVKPHMAGRTATMPSNTILSGMGAPKTTVGIDGDFYIDTKAMKFYGPKSNGRWPTAINLRGPQGAAGATGSSGSDGRNAANVTAAGPAGAPGPAGAKGEIGVPGPAGAKGEIGVPGATGTAGPAGAIGSPGSAGPAGINGAQGPPGSAGSPGTNGTNGVKGDTGPAGVKGDTGAPGTDGTNGTNGAKGDTGATGPSNSFIGTIGFPSDIQGTVGSSQLSNPFGSFVAGKNYVLRILIHTFNSANRVSAYPLSLVISASGATPTIWTSYAVANGSFWMSGVIQDEVSLIADIAIDGSVTASSYQLLATVTCGLNTESFPITLSGSYLSTLVGQIS